MLKPAKNLNCAIKECDILYSNIYGIKIEHIKNSLRFSNEFAFYFSFPCQRFSCTHKIFFDDILVDFARK